MKRLTAMLAAAALVAGPLAMGGTALADPKGDHGKGHDRAEARGRDEGRGRYEGRGREEGRGRGDDQREEGRGRWEREGPPVDPRAYDPPPRYYEGPSPRRGGYLPPRASGGIILDLGRYRLRPPPRGYAWVRVGSGFALISTATGQVFDIVPY